MVLALLGHAFHHFRAQQHVERRNQRQARGPGEHGRQQAPPLALVHQRVEAGQVVQIGHGEIKFADERAELRPIAEVQEKIIQADAGKHADDHGWNALAEFARVQHEGAGDDADRQGERLRVLKLLQQRAGLEAVREAQHGRDLRQQQQNGAGVLEAGDDRVGDVFHQAARADRTECGLHDAGKKNHEKNHRQGLLRVLQQGVGFGLDEVQHDHADQVCLHAARGEYDGRVGAQQHRDQGHDDGAVQAGKHAVARIAVAQRAQREQAEADAERKRQER